MQHHDAGRGRRVDQPERILPGKMVATLYRLEKVVRLLQLQPAVRCTRSTFTNDRRWPGTTTCIAINATRTQIDPHGPVRFGKLGARAPLGHWRQTDFVRSATAPTAARSSSCCPDRQERHHSRINARQRMSTQQNDINYVVTEHGVGSVARQERPAGAVRR
jgi:acyl-CoA hydrolase